jgi:formate transporter
MDCAKPSDVVAAMVDASLKKLALGPRDLLIRGAISGALLGAATSLAFGAAVTTDQPLVGAIIFPVGFVMIVLLELVTGSFALLPLAKVSVNQWWVWNQIPVTLGNILGGFLFTGLALYATYKPAKPAAEVSPVAVQVAE